MLLRQFDAWHRLGHALPGPDSCPDARNALAYGYLLDWNLRKSKLHASTATELRITDPLLVHGHFALVRNNPHDEAPEILGIVGRGHTVTQNEALIPFLDEFARLSGATFSAAGEIDNGKRAFVTMEMPGHLKIGGRDVIKNYVSVLAGRDGQSSTYTLITPVHVASGALLNMNFDARPYSDILYMTAGDGPLPARAERALEDTFDFLEGLRSEAERLAEKTVDQAQFDRLITRDFGAPEGSADITQTRFQNKLDKMAALFAKRPDTAWDGLTALAEWYDFYSPVRRAEDVGEDYQRARKAILDFNFKRDVRKAMLGTV